MIIARTGWTFEYVDDLSLSLALDFLDCEHQAGEAITGKVPRFADAWAEPTEQDAEAQFATLATVPGFVRGGHIPEEMREAIRWAEEQKEKHRTN